MVCDSESMVSIESFATCLQRFGPLKDFPSFLQKVRIKNFSQKKKKIFFTQFFF